MRKSIKIKHIRHLLKTVTWRIVATTFTVLLLWILTGNITLSLSAGVIEIVGKMILYYLHERVWYRSNLGVVNKKERTFKD